MHGHIYVILVNLICLLSVRSTQYSLTREFFSFFFFESENFSVGYAQMQHNVQYEQIVDTLSVTPKRHIKTVWSISASN